MNSYYSEFPSECLQNLTLSEEDVIVRQNTAEQVKGELDCLKIGDRAPDFSLEGVLNGERVKVNLNEQKDRWTVVFFYASDFTFV
jgi:hypothetical protein